MINFLAEISREYEPMILPTPCVKYSRQYDIYEIDIGEYPKNTYWTQWGGTYDNYSHYDIVLRYEEFLSKKDTIEEVLNNRLSMIIIDRIAYFNVPKHTWLYPDYATSFRIVFPFLYSALNPNNPSNSVIENTRARAGLELPNITIKLSDNFAGISLNQGFSINLSNNDGYFDNEDAWNLFNTPASLKKSTKEISEYADFKEIRSGFIENTTTDFDQFQITVSDKLRAMNEPVCDTVTDEMFPNVVIDENAVGKNIPVVYGTKTIKLLKLNDTRYMAAEKVLAIAGVYDKDGNALRLNTDYTFDYATGLITVIGFEADKNNRPTDKPLTADTATIRGHANNRIGEIIKDLVTRKTNITYGPTNWNEAEIERYINISPRINIEISSGDIRKAIEGILKSDMAYFIQQHDGKFTIRKYGILYGVHVIPAWALTKKPEKDYGRARENYFSSCVIRYGFTDRDTFKSYLFDGRENEAEDKYHKKILKTFDTDLYGISDVRNFAELLGERYIFLKQTLKLAVGIDTSGMDLLDIVIIAANVNGRRFSAAPLYVIKEINPAQDILALEEIDAVLDITGEYPHTTEYILDCGNKYAYAQDSEFEFIIDGGEL